jgi:hypothetical protein
MNEFHELEQQTSRKSYSLGQFEKAWELVKSGQHSELSMMRRTKLPRKSIERLLGIRARVVAEGCFPKLLYWKDVVDLRPVKAKA